MNAIDTTKTPRSLANLPETAAPAVVEQAKTGAPKHAPLPRLDGVPHDLRTMIRTTFLLVTEMNLDHEGADAARDIVAKKWVELNIRKNDEACRKHVILAKWAATLDMPGFRILKDWNPETFDNVARRLLDRRKRLGEDQQKQLVRDLHDVGLIDGNVAMKMMPS